MSTPQEPLVPKTSESPLIAIASNLLSRASNPWQYALPAADILRRQPITLGHSAVCPVIPLAFRSAYGVRHNKCVDDELIMRLFHDDAELMAFIGAEYDMFTGWHIPKSKKAKGQRKACGCIVGKGIGADNTCPHLYRYGRHGGRPSRARRAGASQLYPPSQKSILNKVVLN